VRQRANSERRRRDETCGRWHGEHQQHRNGGRDEPQVPPLFERREREAAREHQGHEGEAEPAGNGRRFAGRPAPNRGEQRRGDAVTGTSFIGWAGQPFSQSGAWLR
jgi:hypothetical protein